MPLLEPRTEVRASPAQRRGRHLTPINTSLKPATSLIIQKASPVEAVAVERPREASVVIEHAPPMRSASRVGFLTLFSRSKTLKKGVAEKHPDRSHPTDDRSIAPHEVSRSGSIAALQHRERGEERATAPPKSVEAATARTDRKTSLRSAPSSSNLKQWTPPPLFQVYPQALLHSHLPAPTASAEAILRGDKQGLEAGRLGSVSHHVPEEGDLERVTSHRRRTSVGRSDAYWTDKIFALTTSGYVLQYAGHGHFDRQPEKIMQLGPESAAFASDAIPGRHWVLRIVQTYREEGTPATKAKAARAKLGFWSEMRKSVSNFLLVMESPENMNKWLVAVRKQIEALGGKQYKPEVGRSPTVKTPKLAERPSRRFLVTRDSTLLLESQLEQQVDAVDSPAPSKSSKASKTSKTSNTSNTSRTSIALATPTTTAIHKKNLSFSKPFNRSLMAQQSAVVVPAITHTPTAPVDSTAEKLDATPRLSGLSYASRSSYQPAVAHGDDTFDFHQRGNRQSFVTSTASTHSQASHAGDGSPNNHGQFPDYRLSHNFSQQPIFDMEAPLANFSTSPTTPNFSVPVFSKRFSQSSLSGAPGKAAPDTDGSAPVLAPSAATPPRESRRRQVTPPPAAAERSEAPSRESTNRPESIIADLPPPRQFRSSPQKHVRALPAAGLTSSSTNNLLNLPPADTSLRPHSAHADYPSLHVPPKSHHRLSHQAPLHPPPTSALPAVPPTQKPSPAPSTSHAQPLPAIPPPPPAPAPASTAPVSASRTLRRPASMQARLSHPPKLRAMASQPRFSTAPPPDAPLPPPPTHEVPQVPLDRAREKLALMMPAMAQRPASAQDHAAMHASGSTSRRSLARSSVMALPAAPPPTDPLPDLPGNGPAPAVAAAASAMVSRAKSPLRGLAAEPVSTVPAPAQTVPTPAQEGTTDTTEKKDQAEKPATQPTESIHVPEPEAPKSARTEKRKTTAGGLVGRHVERFEAGNESGKTPAPAPKPKFDVAPPGWSDRATGRFMDVRVS